MRRLWALPLLPLAAIIASGACATTREGNRGAPCERASECAPGLFCVDRLCTDDLSRLDGGGNPSFDTGTIDANTDGADAVEVDPDAPPPPDTGMPPPDTMMPPPDTAMPDTKPPPDTAMPDTFVPDTSLPDTSVADTAAD